MFGIRDRSLGVLVGLLFAPFALQLLGWAGTPLGGGPCGAIGIDQLMLEQPQAFFYAQIMLWGISLLMATGFFVLMLSFMHNGSIPKSQAQPFLRVAVGIAVLTAAVYIATHTWGLPAPSPIGWLMSGPEPTDTIGVLILLALLLFIGMTLRWFGQADTNRQPATPSQAHRSDVM